MESPPYPRCQCCSRHVGTQTTKTGAAFQLSEHRGVGFWNWHKHGKHAGSALQANNDNNGMCTAWLPQRAELEEACDCLSEQGLATIATLPFDLDACLQLRTRAGVVSGRQAIRALANSMIENQNDLHGPLPVRDLARTSLASSTLSFRMLRCSSPSGMSMDHKRGKCMNSQPLSLS